MQKFIGILIFAIISLHQVNSKLNKLTCRTSGSGTCVDPFCYTTPVDSITNAASFGCGNITRPLNKLKIKQEFYFKFFQNYIPFNIFPEVEYCEFLRNPNRLSFFYSIYNVLKEKVPAATKSCPYLGRDFQVKNLIVKTKDLALWITGEYKLIYTFYDDIDPRIYQVSAIGVIKRT